MTGITVRVEGLDALIKKNRRLASRVNAEFVQVVKDTGHNTERRAKTMAPKDRGLLAAEIRCEFFNRGFGVIVGPRDNVKNRTMEYGRKPGKFPPWRQGSELYGWVGRHTNIRMRNPKPVYHMGVNVSRRAAVMNFEKARLNTSFLVARKIAQRGIRPHWYMRTAMWGEEAAFVRNLNRALYKAVTS